MAKKTAGGEEGGSEGTGRGGGRGPRRGGGVEKENAGAKVGRGRGGEGRGVRTYVEHGQSGAGDAQAKRSSQ